MTGNNKLGIYFVYFVDLVKLRVKTDEVPEDSKVTQKIFSDILKAPHSKEVVKIDKLPVLFSKNRKDSKLLDVSYLKYQKDLQITKKLLKKHKKTRKNKNK